MDFGQGPYIKDYRVMTTMIMTTIACKLKNTRRGFFKSSFRKVRQASVKAKEKTKSINKQASKQHASSFNSITKLKTCVTGPHWITLLKVYHAQSGCHIFRMSLSQERVFSMEKPPSRPEVYPSGSWGARRDVYPRGTVCKHLWSKWEGIAVKFCRSQ